MKTYEGMAGDHISGAAEECVRLVARDGEPIGLEFNEVIVEVKPGMSAGDVVATYHRMSDERRAAYVASPEYKEQQRAAEVKAREDEARRADAILGAPEHMTLKDPGGWAKAQAANTDGYGGAVMTYAERWARIMEKAIGEGTTIADCAKEASHLADEEGITGFMYGAAVATLAKVWVHGEELRRWHNLDTQIKNEGEKANESGGVLNPALLNIG